MDQLLDRFGIRYAYLDDDAMILAGGPGEEDFWGRLGLEVPGSPQTLAEIFPEFVGLEEDLDALIRSGQGELRIPSVRRGEGYFNIAVFPCPDGAETRPSGSRAVVTTMDISPEMRVAQELVQSRNEITLLSRQLERRNEELRDANRKGDRLMDLVRQQNHDLDTKVKIRTKELHESRLSVITTLAKVAEFRDTDTGGHIYRIGRSCVLVGRVHGLDAAECERLFYSSLLHDVGKIGIPDSILLKRGPLTPEEWTVMRKHTTIGGEILDRKDHVLFESARDVALCHHERWDGSGYPKGLAGEDIPLMARICAVADVFDALTSRRPYKEPWTRERALDFLREGAGAHFDPAVVESFLSVLADVVGLPRESEDLELLLPEFG